MFENQKVMNQIISGEDPQKERNLPAVYEWSYPVVLPQEPETIEAEEVPDTGLLVFPGHYPTTRWKDTPQEITTYKPVPEARPLVSVADMVTVSRIVVPAGAVLGAGYAGYVALSFLLTQWYFWVGVTAAAVFLALRSVSRDIPRTKDTPKRGDVITNVYVRGQVGNVITNVFVDQQNSEE